MQLRLNCRPYDLTCRPDKDKPWLIGRMTLARFESRTPSLMQNRMSKNTESILGPNTAARMSILQSDCIMCAGEDRSEFLAALKTAGMTDPAADSKYRCYEFWNFGDRCAILTGIGTGCLEPALWEILQPGIVKSALYWSAQPGSCPAPASKSASLTSSIGPGSPVRESTCLRPICRLRPRWNIKAGTLVASSVSTDFYYGFGPQLVTGDYPIPAGPLHRLYEMHARQGTQLVEMEVAEFVFFL